LSGTRHSVITGLAVLLPPPPADADPQEPSSWRLLASETTYVTMRRLSGLEIDQYVASGEWRDKAGAYAIQQTADRFVRRIEGSFTNVVGLPMELLGRMLRQVRRAGRR
jgi:septum formation protein